MGGFYFFKKIFPFFYQGFIEGPAESSRGTTKSWTCTAMVTIVPLPCNDEHPY